MEYCTIATTAAPMPTAAPSRSWAADQSGRDRPALRPKPREAEV